MQNCIRAWTKKPRVFGSVLHGTDTEESDLDIVVNQGERTNLFDLLRLENNCYITIFWTPTTMTELNKPFTLYFTVPGTPAPQGSKRIYQNRLVSTNDKTLKPWRAAVTTYAIQAYRRECINTHQDFTPLLTPVSIELTFVLTRPKTHYRSGKYAHILKDNAPNYVGVKPDLDKLVRAVLDSLTDAGVFRDDAQVVKLSATKRYGDNPYVEIQIDTILNQG